MDLHQRDMLRMATIDGARVWHLEDEIGTLTPGKQADIAVIDMRSPHLDGFGDPVAVMVLGAGPADVETVLVGGDVVKRDGKLAGDSVGHALELMHAAREYLRALPDPGRKQASQTSDGPLRRRHAMNEEHTRATGVIKCRPIPRPPGPG